MEILRKFQPGEVHFSMFDDPERRHQILRMSVHYQTVRMKGALSAGPGLWFIIEQRDVEHGEKGYHFDENRKIVSHDLGGKGMSYYQPFEDSHRFHLRRWGLSGSWILPKTIKETTLKENEVTADDCQFIAQGVIRTSKEVAQWYQSGL